MRRKNLNLRNKLTKNKICLLTEKTHEEVEIGFATRHGTLS